MVPFIRLHTIPTIYCYETVKKYFFIEVSNKWNFQETYTVKHVCNFKFVLQGKLPDGRVIAVKQLSQTSHQGKSQFVTEVATISAVQHRNLVKLYGCCIDSSTPLLVYEYHVNGSLDRALFGAHTSESPPPSSVC